VNDAEKGKGKGKKQQQQGLGKHKGPKSPPPKSRSRVVTLTNALEGMWICLSGVSDSGGNQCTCSWARDPLWKYIVRVSVCPCESANRKVSFFAFRAPFDKHEIMQPATTKHSLWGSTEPSVNHLVIRLLS